MTIRNDRDVTCYIAFACEHVIWLYMESSRDRLDLHGNCFYSLAAGILAFVTPLGYSCALKLWGLGFEERRDSL